MDKNSQYTAPESKGTFKLLGQKLIRIIIHRKDVLNISPIKKGKACIISLKNNVTYPVHASQEEVYRTLRWGQPQEVEVA
ncbi:hypothetical protein [Dyadobacter tibetensis]|uniref:hypothetical protein n=1 Tax=Dyadobacter tibetensis TaxID=1211851 RepID=UPI00046EC095|nr:hypothetical protein [Dyadobacter tibetensis]